MLRRAAIAALMAAGSLVLNVGAADAGVACTTTITGQTINDSVTVPPGAVCSISDSTITGNISVGSGGVLFLDNTTVGGSVTTSGGAILPGCDSHIVGNLQQSGNPGTTQTLCGPQAPGPLHVDGNVIYSNNPGSITYTAVNPAVVGGTLTISGNSGDITFNGWKAARGVNVLSNVATADENGQHRRRVRRAVCAVKFGIFYEHQLPRPWAEDSEQVLINNALEQVEFADKLGFDVVWEVEHHFLEEYSHSSAPEVFLAACSQRAPNIRLGHGIVQTPPAFNHPARIAERIAMLDLVSNGRVEFGTGESSSEAELGGFNIDPMLKREMWQEGLEVAVRCMTEVPFTGVDGKYVQMPPRNVVPKPVQKPHPPIWVACSRRDTIHLAAQKGIGALTFAFIDPEEAEHWMTDYYATLENECVPIGKSVNPNVACVTTFMCAPTEDEAVARGIEGANFFGYSLAHFYVFGQHRPGVTDVWAEYLQKRDEVGYSAEVAAAAEQDRLGAKIAQDGITGLRGAIGTPEQIRDYLLRYEEAGVDQIIFVSQAGKNKHEHIMESLELFGREVMPEFMERDDAQVKAKATRVAPMIEKAMARRIDDAPPLPDDYVMPAMPRAWADRTGDENIKAMLEKIQDDRAAGRRDDALGIIGGN